MDISVIIPLMNEEESLPRLLDWIVEVVQKHKLSYEIIMIDDGSTDNSWQILERLQSDNSCIKCIKFRRNYGKSAGLSVGFERSRGDVIVTMDADLQDSPDEIIGLYRMIKEEGYDLVSGWKKERHDPLSKTMPSKLFNAVARKVSGIELHDFNCGLKAYRHDVIKDIHLYGDMHRWVPILAKWQGYDKIGEKIVAHRPRQFGYSKFGAKRLISGFLDLLSVFFVGKFNKKPMHFFGSLGTLFLFVGFLSLAYLSISKLIYSQSGIQNRPLFFFGILTLIVGSQLFLTGFLAELIIDSKAKANHYNIEKEIGE